MFRDFLDLQSGELVQEIDGQDSERSDVPEMVKRHRDVVDLLN